MSLTIVDEKLVYDMPEDQTVSSGFVTSLLERYKDGGPWVRVSSYYSRGVGCRIRDFQNQEGEIFCACEIRIDTPHSSHTRLVLVGQGELSILLPGSKFFEASFWL